MKKSKGFTLIELLVVISVIAILVGVVIPRFKGMQDEANKTKAKSELKTLQTAVESYFINQDPQAYPDTTTTICVDYLNVANPLIVSAPLYDPFQGPGSEYSFIVSNNGQYYVIYSAGPTHGLNITGISDEGVLTGEGPDVGGDDIFTTNGSGWPA